MEDEARALAQSLLTSGESSYVQIYPLTDKAGEPSGIRVVVAALLLDESGAEKLSEAIRAIAHPPDDRCPECGGTGRVG